MKEDIQQQEMLDRLFKQEIKKTELLTENDCAELGLFGEGYAEFDEDYYDEEEEDE